MFFRLMYDDRLAAGAYIIGCQRTGEAIVVDPERDIDRYEHMAAANGLRIVAATETHIHADFLSGTREFAEKGAKVFLSDEGDADWKYAWPSLGSSGQNSARPYAVQLVRNDDVFRVGMIEFRVVHTPGHTPEHICFMVTDRGGGADRPLGVLTGDFVFVGDVGRPDLLESAVGKSGQAGPAARRLWHSMRRFMEWPDHLQLWPAHGAGSACGKALGAVPQSTVGYEKMFNPAALAAASSEDGFVSSVLEGQPEPPLYFARMKRDNKAGAPVLGGRLPQPPRISAGAAATAAQQGPGRVVIDTRPWAQFRAGHLGGSLSILLGNSFATDAGSLVDESEAISLVIDADRLDEAVRNLVRIGLDRIDGWVDAQEFNSAKGLTLETISEVTIAEGSEMIRNRHPFLLDARRQTEFSQGHIPGAVNISHTRLRSRLSELPKDRPILVNCRSGVRSARACSLLQMSGFDVTNLAGGFLAWEKTEAVEGAPQATTGTCGVSDACARV